MPTNLAPPPIDNDPAPPSDEAKKKLMQFISMNSWASFKNWLNQLWSFLQGITFDGNKGLGSINGLPATPGMAQLLGSGANGFIGGFQNVYPTGLRRRSINGSFNIGQLGAVSVVSPSGTVYGAVDHFAATNNAGGSFSQSQSTFTFNGVTRRCIVQTVTSVMTNNAGANLWSGVLQGYEGAQVQDLVGSPISISFLFNANWTGVVTVSWRFIKSTSFTYTTTFNCVANVPRFVSITTPPVPAGVNVAYDNTYTADLWIGAANAGTFNTGTLNSWVSGGSAITANTYTNWCVTLNNFIAVAELQVEKGPPTPFERWEFTYELIQCLRYLNNFGSQAPLMRGVTGGGATTGRVGMGLPVAMRATPTPVNIAGLIIFDGSVTNSITSIATNYSGSFEIEFDFNMNAAWPAASRPAILFQQASSFYLIAEII